MNQSAHTRVSSPGPDMRRWLTGGTGAAHWVTGNEKNKVKRKKMTGKMVVGRRDTLTTTDEKHLYLFS